MVQKNKITETAFGILLVAVRVLVSYLGFKLVYQSELTEEHLSGLL